MYARIARVRIGNMQLAVVTSLQSSSPDTIAESEITHQFLEIAAKMKVSDTQQMEILKNLESTFPIKSHDVAVSPTVFEDPMMGADQGQILGDKQ